MPEPGSGLSRSPPGSEDVFLRLEIFRGVFDGRSPNVRRRPSQFLTLNIVKTYRTNSWKILLEHSSILLKMGHAKTQEEIFPAPFLNSRGSRFFDVRFP
ncbi:MAG: hypothetical protein HQM08_26405 [Candidatus Riflebacteria bacterium]|nr:hypothetical protein [Candidatus Riflebacteria bacterium]